MTMLQVSPVTPAAQGARRRATAAVLALACAACGDGPRLPLAAMRIEVVRATTSGAPPPSAEHPWPATEVSADGTVRVGGEPAGVLDRDGLFASPTGVPIARLEESGRIVVGDVTTNGTIDGEGTLRNGTGDELRIELDGRVHGTHAEAPELAVTPVTAETRRTAMFVIAIGLLSNGSADVSVGRIPALE